ncbi:MAG: transposase [Burkholderiales bacterium]|nr:transposase [Burkholderiales bacterium]
MILPFKLTDKQWALVEPLIKRNSLETRGRKRTSDRDVLNSILYVIQLGGSWRRLPKGEGFPSFQTCHRRYKRWIQDGRLNAVLEALAKDLEKRGGIKLSSCFMEEAYKAITSYNTLFINEDGFSCYANPELSWKDRTRLFFESAWVWKLLLLSNSDWITTRLPSNLLDRSNCRDLQPYL